MNHFNYRAGVLHAEDVPLPEIAAAVGTPFYCYSTATLTRHYRVFTEAFAGLDTLVCYAMKANSNQSVIATFIREGAGIDVVSEGELRRALAAGAAPDRIVFSGVAKTAREVSFALDTGILCFNVESEPELERISEIATSKGAHRGGRDPHQSRCRREDPRQDHHRQGGETSSAFPTPAPEKRTPAPPTCPGIRISGVDMHIGSQIPTSLPSTPPTAS